MDYLGIGNVEEMTAKFDAAFSDENKSQRALVWHS
jgi:hypothetical protein